MDYTEMKYMVEVALRSHPEDELEVIADILLACYISTSNVIRDKKKRREAQ